MDLTAEETRRERIRAALRRTIEDQLGDSAAWSMSGPWSTFFEEGRGWRSDKQLNHDLYQNLKQMFDINVTREILFAAADIKISRATMKQTDIGRLEDVAKRYGFDLVCSAVECVPVADCGKGRWANRARRAAQPGEKGALRNVYIASDRTLAETGRILDEAGEDDLFGALLGIPACCRAAYEQFRPLASKKQNDFLPFVLENTRGPTPFDWRLNYAAQYFGPSLLSFFPCSYGCAAAVQIADTTLEMIRDCDSRWADDLVDLQQANVLYTENSGVHLIRAPLLSGRILYEAENVLSTNLSDVAVLLRQGSILEVKNIHAIKIYRGPQLLGELTGEDVSMCIFH
jgi:hypothetical protein